MTHLPTTFRREGWDFTRVMRHGKLALYRKQRGVVQSWEVVRVQHRPDTLLPDGRHLPAHECFPRTRDWGILGWTFMSEEAGRAKLLALIPADAPACYPHAPVSAS